MITRVEFSAVTAQKPIALSAVNQQQDSALKIYATQRALVIHT